MRDIKKLEDIATQLLLEIGENPTRTGLVDTPKRMAKMWLEVFSGYDPTKMPQITTFPNREDGVIYNQILIDVGKFHSFCEHHCALFQGIYYFGYIPNKRIIGLSKIARIVDYVSASLQIQERIGNEVCGWLYNELKPKGMILVLKANHSCKEIRGVKKEGQMTTSIVKGIFEKDIAARQEFFSLTKI